MHYISIIYMPTTQCIRFERWMPECDLRVHDCHQGALSRASVAPPSMEERHICDEEPLQRFPGWMEQETRPEDTQVMLRKTALQGKV